MLYQNFFGLDTLPVTSLPILLNKWNIIGPDMARGKDKWSQRGLNPQAQEPQVVPQKHEWSQSCFCINSIGILEVSSNGWNSTKRSNSHILSTVLVMLSFTLIIGSAIPHFAMTWGYTPQTVSSGLDPGHGQQTGGQWTPARWSSLLPYDMEIKNT